jgi:hypothetical protein
MVAAGLGPDRRLAGASQGWLSISSGLRDHPAAMAGTGRRRRPSTAVDALALEIAGAGLLAAALMVLADFLPIVSVDVASGSCEVINDSSPDLADGCKQSGFERHGPALVLLALVTTAMARGAGVGRSRPAGAALLAVGLVVLGIALLIDLPVTDDTGAIGPRFEGARAQAEIGFTLELVAGALASLAGAARLLRSWLPRPHA